MDLKTTVKQLKERLEVAESKNVAGDLLEANGETWERAADKEPSIFRAKAGPAKMSGRAGTSRRAAGRSAASHHSENDPTPQGTLVFIGEDSCAVFLQITS